MALKGRRTIGPIQVLVGDDADPNTIHSATKGSWYIDDQTPSLWQNTDGATAWDDKS